MPVDVVEVSGAPSDLSGTDLVVAGGPTHAFSMSRASTRRDARTQGARRVGRGRPPGVARGAAGTGPGWFAAFDTRVTKVRRLPGSAARSAARRPPARVPGASHPESFYVLDVAGPLVEGELERGARVGAGCRVLGPLDRLSRVPATRG